MTITLRQVINNYAKEWISQTSDSGYERHFDTDGKYYLLLWEGTSGTCVFDWHDWDNHQFYQEHVKGTFGLFSFGGYGNSVSVRLETTDIGSYPSLEALQEAMQNDWDNLPFVKPQKAHDLHNAHQSSIHVALQVVLDEWL